MVNNKFTVEVDHGINIHVDLGVSGTLLDCSLKLDNVLTLLKLFISYEEMYETTESCMVTYDIGGNFIPNKSHPIIKQIVQDVYDYMYHRDDWKHDLNETYWNCISRIGERFKVTKFYSLV